MEEGKLLHRNLNPKNKSMQNLLEITVEKAAIEWLEQLGYSYKHGNELQRELKKVVLEEELRTFLSAAYPDVPATAIQEAMSLFIQQESIDLHTRNREFHLKLSKGVAVTWKDA